MIPRSESESHQTANHVGKDVQWVKIAVIGQQALYDFRTNTHTESTDRESKMDYTPT
jgi:hypothetical protein